MLNIRDIRALHGPNGYDLAPVALIRYIGERANAELFAAQLADAAAQLGIVCEPPIHHEPSALGERALTWRTPTPTTLALLAQHLLAWDDPPTIAEVREQLADERPPSSQAEWLDAARQRDVPVLRTDGGWQLGHGTKAWVVGDGAPDWTQIGRIPIVAITGTNGKTTTTRLIDHSLRLAGWQTGRTDTDGIWRNGVVVERGDWTGYRGAMAVLSDPRTEIAVLETARGGLLRRGLAFDRCNVAVLTNIADDHLPDRGLATVAEMARAKATIARIATERVVLNADDPILVAEVAGMANAPITWFSLGDPTPLLHETRTANTTLFFVRDEELLLCEGAHERRLMAVRELPLAVGGLARHNIANALAAAAALHALGLSDGQIVLGLASFQPNTRDNPGRLNRFERDGVTIVLDYAHNSDGLRVLLHSAAPLKSADGRLWLIHTGTGDRTDEQLREQGTIIGEMVDRFIIKRDDAYLRGRQQGEIEPLMRNAAEAAGMAHDAMIELDDNEAAVRYALGEARGGDVIAFTVHHERAAEIERLQRWERGEAI